MVINMRCGTTLLPVIALIVFSMVLQKCCIAFVAIDRYHVANTWKTSNLSYRHIQQALQQSAIPDETISDTSIPTTTVVNASTITTLTNDDDDDNYDNTDNINTNDSLL
jgi:hypothetical protein